MRSNRPTISRRGGKRSGTKWTSAPRSTPVNTADTFPGNSGSPAVNARGELIGTLFDGNLPSLEIQFVYDEVTARSIMVDARAIVESLRSVYGRRDLADEMIAGH
ncbi:MAG: S46 family peptidase [Deltaproteobacteria bacterium]|nr:S46 family peptidase [Deltaproteobacteria bacterium]